MTSQAGAWQKPEWIADHTAQYLTDPVAAHDWASGPRGPRQPSPTLLLTVKGRKSGELRHNPLIYQPAGEAYVVIASKGGWTEHPAWYLNLVADPEVELRVGAKRMKARARTAQGAERTKLWNMMRTAYPPYGEYEAQALGREIPVVVLDPID